MSGRPSRNTTTTAGGDRLINAAWPFVGDEETPSRYIGQLADALWRHENAENWATLDALVIAARAVGGDLGARRDLDENPYWRIPERGRVEGVQ